MSYAIKLNTAQRYGQNLSLEIRGSLMVYGNMSDWCGVVSPKNVWRVSEDGEISDRYMKLRKVFEMKETTFFTYYSSQTSSGIAGYLEACRSMASEMAKKIPEIPFSHLWVAQQLHDRIPSGSVMHYGILSPLRSWGYFERSKNIETYCNQGGFGIDGNMSSLIGASWVHPERLHFGVFGDLSFFYDINSLGNRHAGNNLRILLVNNSLGAEFHLFKQRNSIFVNDVEKYISAGGHFGHKSPTLVKDFVNALGFDYISATSKEEFKEKSELFVNPKISKSIVFEVFVDVAADNDALYKMWNIETSALSITKTKMKDLISGGGYNRSVQKIQNISGEY